MKHLIYLHLLITILISASLGAQTITDSLVIHFQSDKYSIPADEQQKLNAWVMKHPENQIRQITLTGHTDGDGSEIYNQSLAENRAAEVAAFLTENKIDPGKIKTTSYGETLPVALNSTNQGKQANRRVVLKWSEEPTTVITKNKSDINDLFKLLKDDIEEFCIDNNRDTILTGQQGAKIFIPANAFNCKQQHTECISFYLKESLENSEIIGERLSTFTNTHDVLQSGGMLWVQASCEHHKFLDLNSASRLTIFLPSESEVAPMKLYLANKNESGWKLWQEPEMENNVVAFAGRDIYNFMYHAQRVKPCPLFFCKILKPFRKEDFAEGDQIFGNPGNIDCVMPYNGPDYFNVQKGWTFDSNTISNATLSGEFGLSNRKVYDQMMYVAKTADLGWINYDCLWQKDPIAQKVNIEKDPNLSVMMIFKNKKGVLPANDNMEFLKIPKDEPVYVIGIQYINDKILFAKLETETSTDPIDLVFNEISKEELVVEIKGLNN